jgi:superfamily II DNA or RNA helicase
MDMNKKYDTKMNVSQVSNYIRNFPFPTLREKQSYVLSEIDAAIASDYSHIIVQALTGFGKSPGHWDCQQYRHVAQ